MMVRTLVIVFLFTCGSFKQGLLSGEIHLVVGTHSLIASSVKFASLRLAVIDEQHRFGVEQRMRLQNKVYILKGFGRW
jgi:ATP-dependent DNA helicase RecG